MSNVEYKKMKVEDLKESKYNPRKIDMSESYDELRLFDIGGLFKDLEQAGTTPEELETLEDMELKPFEHYDYVIILARNTQDWYWMQELFKLKKVNASPVGSRKIGLGRAIPVERLREVIKNVRIDEEEKDTED